MAEADKERESHAKDTADSMSRRELGEVRAKGESFPGIWLRCKRRGEMSFRMGETAKKLMGTSACHEGMELCFC